VNPSFSNESETRATLSQRQLFVSRDDISRFQDDIDRVISSIDRDHSKKEDRGILEAASDFNPIASIRRTLSSFALRTHACYQGRDIDLYRQNYFIIRNHRERIEGRRTVASSSAFA